MQGAVLGIDTSNYKTSAALVSAEGRVLCDRRRFLDVPEKERGLRQQNALFQHVLHLPELLEDLFSESGVTSGDILAVSVSTRPRPVEGSYMPVFLAGEGTARSLAAALHVPLIRTSHQEGHIRAAAQSSGMEIPERMISFHFSGGTTEAVLLDQTKRKRQEAGWYQKVGGTEDLAAGQVLDRIGVQLGFPFPCGQYLDQLALEMDGCRIPDHELFRLSSIRCKDGFVHFSGLETDCSRRINRILGMDDQELRNILGEEENKSVTSQQTGNSLPDCFLSGSSEEKRTAAALMVLLLMRRITRAAALMTADLAEQYDIHAFLLAGGVASSQFMRDHFHEELKRSMEKYGNKGRTSQNQICFGTPQMSSDNAVGTALLGLDALLKENQPR
jgi:N6-L-threonylcarbamoyladenine synthase